MDPGTLGALRMIQEGRAREIGRKLASQLQSVGLIQRMNGELCLTAKGVAMLNAGSSTSSPSSGAIRSG